jgi:hypothetical protein
VAKSDATIVRQCRSHGKATRARVVSQRCVAGLGGRFAAAEPRSTPAKFTGPERSRRLPRDTRAFQGKSRCFIRCSECGSCLKVRVSLCPTF